MKDFADQKVLHDLLECDFNESTFDWQPFRAGVDIVPLHSDVIRGCSSALLRYQPGAVVPQHSHRGFEYVFILRGSQKDNRGEYFRGSFIINKPGSHHQVSSSDGCVALVIWESPILFHDA